MLDKLMKVKKKEPMDPMYKDAKMDMLQKLHKMMSDGITEDMKGLKKVTVAAPDQEGLKMGLDKAEDIVEGGEHVMPDGSKMKDSEMENLTPEECDAMIAMLQAKKAEMTKV